MAAVDVPVRVDRDVARVGVLADDDVAAGVAQHLEALGDGRGIAGGLDDDVGAAAARAVADPARRARRDRGISRDVADVLGAEPPRRLEPRRAARRRRARATRRRAARRSRRSSRPGRCPGRRPCRRARRRARSTAWKPVGQAAAAADESRADRRPSGSGTTRTPGLSSIALRPAAEQAVVGGGRDAVDAAVRAARRGPRDEAVPAGAAGAEDVVERHERRRPRSARPSTSRSGAVRLEHAPAADVARDDRVGNAREAAVVEVDVRAADLGRDRLEHGAAGLGTRRGEGPRLDRPGPGRASPPRERTFRASSAAVYRARRGGRAARRARIRADDRDDRSDERIPGPRDPPAERDRDPTPSIRARAAASTAVARGDRPEHVGLARPAAKRASRNAPSSPPAVTAARPSATCTAGCDCERKRESDGERREDRRPEERQCAAEREPAACLRARRPGPASDDVEREGRGERVQGRGLGAHRRREDPRDEVGREQRRQVADDESREDRVGRVEAGGPRSARRAARRSS